MAVLPDNSHLFSHNIPVASGIDEINPVTDGRRVPEMNCRRICREFFDTRTVGAYDAHVMTHIFRYGNHDVFSAMYHPDPAACLLTGRRNRTDGSGRSGIVNGFNTDGAAGQTLRGSGEADRSRRHS